MVMLLMAGIASIGRIFMNGDKGGNNLANLTEHQTGGGGGGLGIRLAGI